MASRTEVAGSPATVRRVLQRFVLPADRDLDVVPLYVDTEDASLDADRDSIGSNKSAQALNKAAARQAISSGTSLRHDDIIDRRTLRVEPSSRLSLGTYFNGFPASYWRRWTVVEKVRLDVTVLGAGANVIVYRSMANGRSQRVDGWTSTTQGPSSASFDLTLTPFVDGGWYWFDIVSGDDEVILTEATWSAEVPAGLAETGRVTIGITTMNRPDFCAELLAQIGEDADVQSMLDAALVMEQGTQKVVDDPAYAKAEAALGDKLRIIEQGNIGGSGGFARAQFEALKGTSKYVLFLDDDIVAETESIVRAVTFGDLARRPTIVGGHMFSIYQKSQLHSFGEIIQRHRFWWMSPKSSEDQWDFGARNLRSTRWLHRRVDVDFNPWFMCLIPLDVVREIGLSLPLFIKWDDSEYGLRAQAAGVPTVSMPGAAVWHVPWTDKNDALDWQAYFHQRNRFVAALLHSPFPHGGRMVRESVNHQIKHLIAMQYSTVELRHLALEDVLAGPEGLHEQLGSRLGYVREFRKDFGDAQLQADPDAFPPVRHSKPRKKNDTSELPGRVSQLASAVIGGIRQFRPVRGLSREFPERNLPAMDARWYTMATLDSAIVSMPDGTSAAFYKRDPEKFRDLLARTVAIHERLYREWPELSARYRAALPEITSPEVWEKTFADSGAADPREGRDVSKAADRSAAADVDERGRRKNAAKRARALMEKKANAMPVVEAPDGPRQVRVVDAELVDPSPHGGIVEVFQQRYLLKLIVQRQLAQMYAASVLGLLWSYIQPAMRFGVYYFVFGVVISGHGAGTQNFALHLFAGMVFVHYFSETWSSGTRSVRQNRALLLKMRMPREIFPVASMVTAMYHTGPQILILLVICLLVGWSVSLTSIAAGLLGLAILLSFAMAMALFFSALNVYYKDFQNIVATFTQFLHFMVPMMYPYSTIHRLQDAHPVIYQVYMANPLAESVLLMQRFFWYPTINDPDKVLVKEHFPPDLWERGLIMLACTVLMLFIAQKFFARLEPKFPERL